MTAQMLNVPFLGRIPLDPRVALSGDAGMPIVAAEPESASTEAFLELAKAVAKSVGA